MVPLQPTAAPFHQATTAHGEQGSSAALLSRTGILTRAFTGTPFVLTWGRCTRASAPTVLGSQGVEEKASHTSSDPHMYWRSTSYKSKFDLKCLMFGTG